METGTQLVETRTQFVSRSPGGVFRDTPLSPTAPLTALAAAGRNPTDLTRPTAGSHAGGDSPDIAGTITTAAPGGIMANGMGSDGSRGGSGDGESREWRTRATLVSRHLHGLDQLGQEGGRLVGRLRRPRQRLRQAVSFEELHREVRPSFVVARIVDLNDIRVAQARHRLRSALKPRPLVRSRVRAGDQHFEGDEAVEGQVPGLVDEAHAPAAE